MGDLGEWGKVREERRGDEDDGEEWRVRRGWREVIIINFLLSSG